jgi:hypothetical protein
MAERAPLRGPQILQTVFVILLRSFDTLIEVCVIPSGTFLRVSSTFGGILLESATFVVFAKKHAGEIGLSQSDAGFRRKHRTVTTHFL